MSSCCVQDLSDALRAAAAQVAAASSRSGAEQATLISRAVAAEERAEAAAHSVAELSWVCILLWGARAWIWNIYTPWQQNSNFSFMFSAMCSADCSADEASCCDDLK